MANDTSSLKKAAVLTGLTVLMGNAAIPAAEAETLSLPPSVSQTTTLGQTVDSVTTDLLFNQFAGPGTLTGVEFDLTSTIDMIATGGGTIQNFTGASVSVNGHQLGAFSGNPFNFDVTDNLAFADASFYSGSSTFPVGLQISGFQCVEALSCSVNWTGSLEVTFESSTTTPTPLPASLPLLVTGLGALGLAAGRGRRKQKPAT